MGIAYKYYDDLEDPSDSFSQSGWFGGLDDAVPVGYVNILLVEDDTTTLDYLKTIIRKVIKTPCRIRSFKSGSMAFKYIMSLKANHLPGPDYAIIDFLLDGPLNGLRLCRLLEDRFPETQSFLMSNLTMDKIKSQITEYGSSMPMFLAKPFEPSQLSEILS